MAVDDPMRSEVRAWYAMYSSQLDPERVTHSTGITPSDQWDMGDVILGGTRVYEYSGWRLQSSLDKSATVESHFTALLERLRGQRITLAELAKEYHAEVEFSADVWSYNGDRPELHLPHELVREIADMGASIDIDLFIVDDE